MNKSQYEAPECQFIAFQTSDIITSFTSTANAVFLDYDDENGDDVIGD